MEQPWTQVIEAESSNQKADAYQRLVMQALDRFFPLRQVKRRALDPPWMNDTIRKKERAKKKLFRRTGRSREWENLNNDVMELIDQRRRGYLEDQRAKLTGSDATKHFYSTIKNYKSAERPAQYDVRDLFPGLSDSEAANELALFFNRISQEFKPLDSSDIPKTSNRKIELLEPYQVSARLRKLKKPASMVPTDIFPKLMTSFSDFLAIPLTNIYNAILETGVWPSTWKLEFVTTRVS